MPLLEKISEDMKTAMKKGDKIRLETLRMIRAGLLEKAVEKRPSGGMTADDEIAVLNSAAKKRKESIEVYRKSGREDLAVQEEKELAIVQEYLPEQLTPEEVELYIKKVINETSASGQKDFGRVMPVVMRELKGKTDGKLVQELVKKLLG